MTGKGRLPNSVLFSRHSFPVPGKWHLCPSTRNPSACESVSGFRHLHRDWTVMMILQCIQALDSNCSLHIPSFLNPSSSLVSDPTTRLNLPQITKCNGIQNCSPPAAPSMGLSPLLPLLCISYMSLFAISIFGSLFSLHTFIDNSIVSMALNTNLLKSPVFLLKCKLPMPTAYLKSHLDGA